MTKGYGIYLVSQTYDDLSKEGVVLGNTWLHLCGECWIGFVWKKYKMKYIMFYVIFLFIFIHNIIYQIS